MSDEIAIRAPSSPRVRSQPSMVRAGAVAVLVFLAAALGPTLLFSDYHLFQLTMVVVYAIAILGLAILTGFNGQISLGHGAFYAIGAYTTAILMYAVRCAVLGDAAGLRDRLRRRRLPDRPAGAAPGRAVSGADHLRAGRRGSADPEAQRDRRTGPAACRAW